MSSRVEKRKEETRERIVRAAFGLFGAKGFEATTVAEISQAADIGKGTFFTYFATKEAVLTEVGQLLIEKMSTAVLASQQLGGTAAEQLERALLPGIEWHAANPALSRLSLTVLMHLPSALEPDPSVTALEALLVAILEAGEASGELRPGTDPRAGAAVLLGLYFVSLLGWHQAGTRGDLEANTRAGLRVILEGLVQ
jgi:AcrR family transcriptional regulator